MAVGAADFNFIRELVKTKAGIVLEDGKEYLVEARLGSVIRQQKIDSIAALVARLRGNSMDPLQRLTIEAMTTNETSFFRDHHPFEALGKKVLPELLGRRAASKTLSIWCAASSAGQEPYTIAMTLLESFPAIVEWKLTFVATDISSEMIGKSKAGKYNQIEINRGLPAALMIKYFEKHGLNWQVNERLRKMIDFRELNLTQSWPGLQDVDIVFMRNVLIYFDTETKRGILGRVRRVMKPDGYLFLGGAETPMSLDEAYERSPIEMSGCYRIKNNAAKVA